MFARPGQDVIAREQRAWDMSRASAQQAADRERWEQLGRALLGQRQEDRRERGEGFVWVGGGFAQSPPAGFPDRYLASARAAAAAEAEARRAFALADQRARQWIQENHPSQELARAKYEEYTLDQVNRVRQAIAATEAAAVELGRTVEAYTAARAVVDSATAKRAAAEQSYRQQLAAIDAETSAAELTLSRI